MARLAPGTDTLLVRPAAAQDASGVATLLGVLGYPCDRDEAAGRLRAVAEEPGHQVLVADRHGCLGGRVAGVDGEALGLENRLAVALDVEIVLDHQHPVGHARSLIGFRVRRKAHDRDPRVHRPQGPGQQEQRARQAGAARIELTSGAQRAQAHDFYRACGYEDGALRFLKRLGA